MRPLPGRRRSAGALAPRRPRSADAPRPGLDAESQSWWKGLHAAEPVRGWALAEVHERLRREAAFHIRLIVGGRSAFPGSDLDDLAVQAADDALMALLGKLEDYRGDSQFWTWARQFAALEALVSVRRRLGPDRLESPWDPERLLDAPDPGPSVHEAAELRELVQTVSDLIADALTARQRTVMTAVAINGVSARTLAGELHTTPGAIYKTLHDARRKLRAHVGASRPETSDLERKILGPADARDM
jgi:RNA polymerase sigma-70 factor (ECF subfamily)